MSKNIEWIRYVNEHGDFELPAYLYKSNLELMKTALDLGTLLSEDAVRLRAYKEQIKSIFKQRWLDTAKILESFDMITRCVCQSDDYCKVCSGSRYLLDSSVSPDKFTETAFVTNEDNVDMVMKLEASLAKAIVELEQMNTYVMGTKRPRSF